MQVTQKDDGRKTRRSEGMKTQIGRLKDYSENCLSLASQNTQKFLFHNPKYERSQSPFVK